MTELFARPSYKLPRYFLLSLESIGLLVQEKTCKIDFQDGGRLGFLIEAILAILGLNVTLSSFESIGPGV